MRRSARRERQRRVTEKKMLRRGRRASGNVERGETREFALLPSRRLQTRGFLQWRTCVRILGRYSCIRVQCTVNSRVRRDAPGAAADSLCPRKHCNSCLVSSFFLSIFLCFGPSVLSYAVRSPEIKLSFLDHATHRLDRESSYVESNGIKSSLPDTGPASKDPRYFTLGLFNKFHRK